MHSRMTPALTAALTAAALLLPQAAPAQFVSPPDGDEPCLMATAGAKCIRPAAAPAPLRPPPVQEEPAFAPPLQPGDRIPAAARMVLNPQYRGLPPVEGGWRYYRIDGSVYRVRPDTMEILSRVEGGNATLR